MSSSLAGMNLEDLEEGEIEDDVDDRERRRDNSTLCKRIVPVETKIRPNRNLGSGGCGISRNGLGRSKFRRDYFMKVIKSNKRRCKGIAANISSWPQLQPPPLPIPVKMGDGYCSGNMGGREWPKTFHHIAESDKSRPLMTSRLPPSTSLWEGRRVSRSPRRSPERNPPSRSANNNKLASRNSWCRSKPRPRTIVNQPRQRVSNIGRRTFSSHEEMSYEDLLAQYKEIQSQLDELNRQDTACLSRPSDGDETLDKENLKDVRRNRKSRHDERNFKLRPDKAKMGCELNKTKARRHSRARSLAGSKSHNSETKTNQEDDDEQELRRIALASTRNRMPVKSSENDTGEGELNSEEATSKLSGTEQEEQLFDNYEEVAMELDSNSESAKGESDDEDALRESLLQSLSQKQTQRPVLELPSKHSQSRPNTPVKIVSEFEEKTVKTVQAVKPVGAPLHERVVINLGEDSSESEQEENQITTVDVDKLLKEARQKSDAQQAVSHLSTAQMKEYFRLKEIIAKREQVPKVQPSLTESCQPSSVRLQRVKDLKAGISKSEQDLQVLKTTLFQKKRILSIAEQKVKRIQEQLANAQKVVVANKNSIIKITSQVRLVQKKINDDKKELDEVNDEIAKEVNFPASNKRQFLPSQTPVSLKKGRYTATATINGKKNIKRLTPLEIAAEKARLQEMEKEVSLKLKELRRAKGIEDPVKTDISCKEKNSNSSLPKNVSVSRTEKRISNSPKVEMNNKQSLTVTIHNNVPSIVHTDQGNKRSQDTCLEEILLGNTKTSIVITQSKWDFLYFPIISKINSLHLHSNDFVPNSTQNNNKLILDPLLHIKSSRLTPSFVQKLTSSTYTHKLDPNWILCPYDLLGVCNDDNCPWQHEHDYSLKPEEIISDLVSYCPDLCGVSDNVTVESLKHSINKYAEKILQGTTNQVSLDEVCSQLVIEISHHLPAGERLKTNPRLWKVEQQRKMQKNNEADAPVKHYQIHSELETGLADEVRYFDMHVNSTELLEKKVLDDSHDISSWLKLAGIKKSNLPKTNLDEALNVLSRALDSNQHSEELWLHYLTLYRLHPESSDFNRCCQQALTRVPSYNLWWKYLSCTKSFKSKLAICTDMANFVKTSDNEMDCRSHRLLEITLFKVQLKLQAGHIQDAIDELQSFLTDVLEIKFLSGGDLCFAWLMYIHIEIFKVLPSSAVDACNENPSHLVNKSPILIVWQSCPSYQNKSLDLLKEAIASCELQNIPLISIIPLYQNLISLLLINEQFDEAEEICQDLVNRGPSLDDSWILFATVLLEKCNYNGCLTILQTAIHYLMSNPRIQLLGAAVAHQFFSSDVARDLLTQSIRNLFNTDQGDPEVLYRHALGISQACDNTLPCVDTSVICKDEYTQMNLWLSYCILLQLDNQDQKILDTLEIALARLSCLELLQDLWLFYLHSSANSFGTSPTDENIKHWVALYQRCLASFPSDNSLTFLPKMIYYSQEFQSDLVDLFIERLQDDSQNSALSLIYSWLPRNSSIFIRYLKLLFQEKDYQSIVFLVTEAIGNNMIILDASRLSIYAARQVMSTRQAFNLYHQLTSAFPYSYQLWEDAVTSLKIMGNHEGAKDLCKSCEEFLDEFCISKLNLITNGSSTSIKTNTLRTHPPEINVSIHLGGDGDSCK